MMIIRFCNIFQDGVIFKVLDHILSESNQASFSSLQEAGTIASQAALLNAERYGQYITRAIQMKLTTGKFVNHSGENMGREETCTYM